MPTQRELWDLIEPVVKEAGLVLFDLDVPSSRSGLLRVYISRNDGRENRVGIEDCATVSKRLSALEGFDDLFDQAWTLEVSSPGLNRRLTRPEHFAGAVGERVRMKVQLEGLKSPIVLGILSQFDGSNVTINSESQPDPLCIPLQAVSEARVEYSFDK